MNVSSKPVALRPPPPPPPPPPKVEAGAKPEAAAEKATIAPEVQTGARQNALQKESGIKENVAVQAAAAQSASLQNTVAKKGISNNQGLINEAYDAGKNYEGAAKHLSKNYGKNLEVLAERREQKVDVPGPDSKVAHLANQTSVDAADFSDGHISESDVQQAEANYSAAKARVDSAALPGLPQSDRIANTQSAIIDANQAHELVHQAKQTRIDQLRGPERLAANRALIGEQLVHNSAMDIAMMRAQQGLLL